MGYVRSNLIVNPLARRYHYLRVRPGRAIRSVQTEAGVNLPILLTAVIKQPNQVLPDNP